MAESRLFNLDELATKAKLAKRLTTYLEGGLDPKTHTPSLARRKAATDYPLSTIKGIEKIVKRHLRENREVTVEELKLKNHDFTIIVTKDKEVYIEEKVAGFGSSKVVQFASNYFTMTTPKQRRKYATIQPKPASEKHEDVATISFLSKITSIGKNSGYTYSGEMSIEGDTFVEIESDTFEEIESDTFEEIEDDTFVKKEDSESFMEREIEEKAESKGDVKDMKREVEEVAEKEPEQKIRKSLSTAEEFLSEEEQEEQEYQEYLKEIELSLELQGEGIAKIHSIIDLPGGKKKMIQYAAGMELPAIEGVREEAILIIDLGNALKLLESPNSKEESRNVLLIVGNALDDALHGLQRVHKAGYIHRDIKPKNILLTREGKGALTDFNVTIKSDSEKIRNIAGSPYWIAPEVVKEQGASSKSDVWGVGIMLHQFYVAPQGKEHPGLLYKHGFYFPPEHQINLLYNMEKAKYDDNYPEPKDKESFEHLIWECTRLDPKDRPTIEEVRQKFNAIRKGTHVSKL